MSVRLIKNLKLSCERNQPLGDLKHVLLQEVRTPESLTICGSVIGFYEILLMNGQLK